MVGAALQRRFWSNFFAQSDSSRLGGRFRHRTRRCHAKVPLPDFEMRSAGHIVGRVQVAFFYPRFAQGASSEPSRVLGQLGCLHTVQSRLPTLGRRLSLPISSLVRRNTDGNTELPRKLEECSVSGALSPRFSLASRALLRSQGGPVAALLFSLMPTARLSRFHAQLFRVLLLRRQGAPASSSDRNCRCRLPLDLVTSILPDNRGLGTKGLCVGKCRTRLSGSWNVVSWTWDMDFVGPDALDLGDWRLLRTACNSSSEHSWRSTRHSSPS